MKLSILSVTLALFAVAGAIPMNMEKRRFGQEHTPRADADFQAMKDISNGTGFEAQLGDLSGAAVRALLAKAGACDQQDVADQCVDIAHQIGQKFASSFGPQKEADLIKVCQDYRTLERNTPNVGQPSDLCNRPPKNKELDGLVQAQDPGTAANGATPTTADTPTTTTNDPATTTTNDPAVDPATTTTSDPAVDPATTTTKAKKGKKKAKKTTEPCKDPSNAGVNNVAFTNPVGGAQMPLITKLDPSTGANFEVNGSKFQNIGAAHNRQCDVQHNLCFNKFNSGDHSFQGSDCDKQNDACKAGDPVFSN
ncbi:16829_t:CDS:2 [Acaulospora morrowiae]|uniref:16829_t:CDS:1 n=1 Tax=Acaulospora morrowiae TaxID=94023 RepID=A0A9N9AHD0_9GLOM|nr:16829_t:CDS:2 [Acaulospora morrowiae]